MLSQGKRLFYSITSRINYIIHSEICEHIFENTAHFLPAHTKKSRSRGIFCSFLYIFFPEFIFFIAEAAADLDLVRIGEEVVCIFFGKTAKCG